MVLALVNGRLQNRDCHLWKIPNIPAVKDKTKYCLFDFETLTKPDNDKNET